MTMGGAWLKVISFSALAAGLACKPEATTAAPVPPGEPARRSAIAFVHCVETASGGCVDTGLPHGGWDAFFLLGWLADGSPPALLAAFPRELQNHADPREVQARFIRAVEAYGPLLRGAECDPTGVQPLAPLVDQIRDIAARRLEWFGLWNVQMQEVVTALAGEARDTLSDGYLVQMTCRGDPYQLYVATSAEGERQAVVGLSIALPAFLGGEATNRDAVRGRLKSRSLGLVGGTAAIAEGTVDPWLPLSFEEF